MRARGTGSLFQRADGRWFMKLWVTLPDGTRKRLEKSSTDRGVVEAFLQEHAPDRPQRIRSRRHYKRTPEVRMHVPYLRTLYPVCRYCRTDLNQFNMVIDHIIPRTYGGTDEVDNLQLVCWQCNNEKSDKLDYVYVGGPREFSPMPQKVAEFDQFARAQRAREEADRG